MNKLLNEIFNFDQHTIKIMGNFENPWFCAFDVCNILGYENDRKAIYDHVDEEDKKSLYQIKRELHLDLEATFNNGNRACYISESGLYSLIYHSKMPNAIRFQRWITKEVLPSLRKKGEYKTSDNQNDIDLLRNQFEEQLHIKNQQLEQKDQQLEEAEEQILCLKELAVSDTRLDQTQIVYIATSPNYAKRNRFKVGGVQSKKFLKSRLSTYNSCRAVGDFFYYSDIFTVIDYRQIEERLKCLLKRFRDKESKEMYVMYYPELSFAQRCASRIYIQYIVTYLCDHLSDEVEEVNRKLSEFIFNYVKRGKQAIVPKEIEDWKNEEQIDEQEIGSDSIEGLRIALIEVLNMLPPTQTEITKKELFDKLKVSKDRTGKLEHVQQIIKEHRPTLILRERKARVAKKDIKYSK
jgi:prophage antirepressor-like protein